MNNKDRKFGGRLIDIVLITTIVTLTVLAIIFTIANNESNYQNVSANNEIGKQTNPVNSVFPDISSSVTQEIVTTSINGVQIVKETLKDPIKSYSIQYIKTNSETVNAEIKKYISDSKSQYENIIRLKNTVEEHDITSNLVNKLNITVELYPHQKQYVSVVFTKNITLQSNNTDTTIHTLLFNKETGKTIDLEQILNGDGKSLISISEKVRSSILKNKTYQNHVYSDTLTKLTESKWNNFERFSIKNNSLVFYFNKGEIANSSIGVTTATVSLSTIYPLLIKEFQAGIKDGTVITNPPPKADSTNKKVALTFDDGPHPTITMEILDLLDKYDAKATFFLVGNRVEEYADVVIDTVERGHEIGNHTWSHAKLTNISPKQVLDQLKQTNIAIKNVTGQYPTVFRPPYGAKNQEVISLINLPVVMWTIDTLDWKYRDASKLLPSVKESMHNNAIILMHDIHQSTADGLESVLKYLKEQGYEFVTVSELSQYK